MILSVGTCVVSEMTMTTSSVDALTVTRLTVAALDGNKATMKSVTKTGDHESETTYDITLAPPGEPDRSGELVDVPAGRFRCARTGSKSTNSAGTFVTDVWTAPGIPTAVRSTTAGPDMTMETRLVRIENYKARRPAPPQGETYVLVVGINECADPGLPALRAAESDARALADFFASANRSPTTAERVRVLAGKEATRVAILKAVREHLGGKNVREQDAVVLVFAGYAFADAGEGYLLGSDAQLDALPETAISAAALGRYWEQIRARRKVLIVDACRRDGPGGLKGGFPVPAAAESAGKAWTGTLLLWSTRAGQFAAEGDGAGVFTSTLLTGLGGAADADRDGKVSAEELSSFAVREVSSRSGNVQSPVGRTEGTPVIFLTR